ncbi:MAG TPA: UDP-2,3-diacylglucosamine diphosphatase [Gemmatimonadaceae bacterium]|jgi:UDP-2,3-diacylglucosamine hydrolase
MTAQSDKPFLVVSDLHLGAVPKATERAFVEFLRYAAESASGLLINGDLFDVWIASRHFVVRDHVRVLAAIADVVDAGLPVYFVGGNHDALEFGGELLRDDLGVVILEEPAQLTVGTLRALVIHGDGVGRSTVSYKKRHPILRSRWFRWIVQRMVHVDRIYDAVARWSATKRMVARHAAGLDTGPKPAAPLIEAWAREALERNADVDVVFAGHSHLPADVEVAPGKYYINSGDWISHMTYVEIHADHARPRLLNWPTRVPYLSPDPGARTTSAEQASQFVRR